MTKKTKKTNILILTLIFIAATTAGLVYFTFRSNPENNNKIPFEPATETEKAETEANKEDLIREITDSQTKPGTDSSINDEQNNVSDVVVIISSWGQTEDNSIFVNGFIDKIIEEGGKCTLAVNGPTSSTTSGTAFADAKTTNCGQLVIPSKNLKSGTYTLQVSYQSVKYNGKSEAETLEVKL